MGGEQRYGSPHDMPQDDVLHPISRDSGSQAEDLRLKGRCDQAIPILRGLVDRSGSEIAQFNLGLCLFDMAVKDPAHAADMKKEGAQWVLQAADAGLARAQSRAVVLLLEGTEHRAIRSRRRNGPFSIERIRRVTILDCPTLRPM